MSISKENLFGQAVEKCWLTAKSTVGNIALPHHGLDSPNTDQRLDFLPAKLKTLAKAVAIGGTIAWTGRTVAARWVAIKAGEEVTEPPAISPLHIPRTYQHAMHSTSSRHLCGRIPVPPAPCGGRQAAMAKRAARLRMTAGHAARDCGAGTDGSRSNGRSSRRGHRARDGRPAP